MVAVTHVSNVLGLVNPVADVAAIAHPEDAGARGRRPVRPSHCHRRACARLRFLRLLQPQDARADGGGAVGEAGAARPVLRPDSEAHGPQRDATCSSVREHGAQKFQAGTPNVSGPVGLAAAVRYLETLGAKAIAAHDQALVRHGLARLRAIKGIRLLGPADERHRVPVFSFTVSGRTVPDVVAALDREGVAIRGGDRGAAAAASSRRDRCRRARVRESLQLHQRSRPARGCVEIADAMTDQSARDSWLLFIMQLPTRPSAPRIKLWRRLQQLGSVALRGSVYACHTPRRPARTSSG